MTISNEQEAALKKAYAKLSNKNKYYELIKDKYNFDDICDDDFAKIVINE